MSAVGGNLPENIKRPLRARKYRGKLGSGKTSHESRMLLFAKAFVANGENRTQAAIAAGYSPKSAMFQGSKLAKHAKVLQFIEDEQKRLRSKFDLTPENVLRQLGAIVNFDPRRMFDANGSLLAPKDWKDDVAFAVAGVEVKESMEGETKTRIIKHKVWDKNAAISHAMKILGMANDAPPPPPPLPIDERKYNFIVMARQLAYVMREAKSLIEQRGLTLQST